jgi:hypothetical protein
MAGGRVVGIGHQGTCAGAGRSVFSRRVPYGRFWGGLTGVGTSNPACSLNRRMSYRVILVHLAS